ncbi:TIGR03915 family putative DNA repair protein [Paenibacillus sanfengchensis]|uniref:TIGR03915 family putative DNA repair protein n=1 Tax=Paenibacillus sanfengchensis TaxID=3119819 RepID=UPI002FE008AF
MNWARQSAYIYDGSFDGFLSCVFESFDRKEEAVDIRPSEDNLYVLFDAVWVETDPVKAARVYKGIGVKICPAAQELIRNGFLTCMSDKELLLYRFLRLGFQYGRTVMDMLTEDTVHRLHKAVKHLRTESHAYMGFVRFAVYGDVLVAVIEPKNQVLPLLAPHFCDRYRGESFLIYDKTHRQVLMQRQDGPPADRVGLFCMEELILPEPDDEEKSYRRLWKQFYDTVAVRERSNPRARLSHMPKRYWTQLTEMQQSDPSPGPFPKRLR